VESNEKNRLPPSISGANVFANWHTQRGSFAAEARYPSIQPVLVANPPAIREHNELPYILSSHKEAFKRWRHGRSPQELKAEDTTATRFNRQKASSA